MFKFSDNIEVSDIETIPEAHRGLYEEQTTGEGEEAVTAFVLSEAARSLANDYDGSQKALADERLKIGNLNKESAGRRVALTKFAELANDLGFEVPEDGDLVEIYREKFNEIAEKTKEGGKLKIDMDKIKKEADARIERERESSKQQVEEMRTALATHLVDKEAISAINENKGSVALLLPHVKNHSVVEREEDGSYTVRIADEWGNAVPNSEGGWMTVPQFVKSLKSDKDFAAAFESELPKGGGSDPKGSENPGPRLPNVDEDEATGKSRIIANINELNKL